MVRYRILGDTGVTPALGARAVATLNAVQSLSIDNCCCLLLRRVPGIQVQYIGRAGTQIIGRDAQTRLSGLEGLKLFK